MQATSTTDATGKCFVSYRRSHADDVQLIIEAMLDIGVPPWQDRRDLTSQPLAPALEAALKASDTAGCLVWISEDTAESAPILDLEAPLVIQRVRNDAEFFAELWLADGLSYERGKQLWRPSGVVEDVSASWHLERAATEERALEGGGHGRRINHAEAMRVASRLLERRLDRLNRRLAPGEPIRLLFNAHAGAGDAFRQGFGIQLNWSRHFTTRFAAPQVWTDRLLPALAAVLRALKAKAPDRAIVAEGFATLASCLALGRCFREVAGIPVSWTQKPSNAAWKLSDAEESSGFRAEPLRSNVLGARDLAVFVSVTGDVEPAVAATTQLPEFRAVVAIRPDDGAPRRDLTTPGQATHLARLIVHTIREARLRLRTVERTHLFFAGPTGLALLVGQQLNALGPFHIYEHEQTDSVGRYQPAVVLTDPNPLN